MAFSVALIMQVCLRLIVHHATGGELDLDPRSHRSLSCFAFCNRSVLFYSPKLSPGFLPHIYDSAISSDVEYKDWMHMG